MIHKMPSREWRTLRASEDRIVGCLIGGAIGDCLGGPYEGQSAPVHVDPVLHHWQLSDDTQLTLATCEAILETRFPSPESIASAFVRWFNQRKITGIGSSTLKALADLQAGNHWALAGAQGEKAAGNGDAMRIAPLAIFLDPAVDEDRDLIRNICRITHRNDEAYAGALAILSATRAATAETLKEESGIITSAVAHVPDSKVRDVLCDLQSDHEDLTIGDVASRYGQSGYVAESVPLAIFAAHHVRQLGFKQMLIEIVQAGGDTDTIAAMAGSIGGTYLGFSGLPSDWIEALPDVSEIEFTGRKLAQLVKG